jgi:hypothetical protein
LLKLFPESQNLDHFRNREKFEEERSYTIFLAETTLDWVFAYRLDATDTAS